MLCIWVHFITSRVSGTGNIIGPVCVCLFVCLSVCALTAKSLDLGPQFLAWRLTLTLTIMGLKVRVIGQGKGEMLKSCLLRVYFFSLLSEKVVQGQGHEGQGQSSRSQKCESSPFHPIIRKCGPRSSSQEPRSNVKVVGVKVTRSKVKVTCTGRSFYPLPTCGRFDTQAFSFQEN